MTVRLRAHHLLCLLTYVGKGYSPAFTANYDAVVARLEAGEEAELVEGPDVICAPMLGSEHHCRNAGIATRDARAQADIARLLDLHALEPGWRFVLNAAIVARLRAAFVRGSIRGACLGCQWSALCDDVAASGFRAVRFHGGEDVPALSLRPGFRLHTD